MKQINKGNKIAQRASLKKSLLLQLIYNNNKKYIKNLNILYNKLYSNIYQLLNSNKAIKINSNNDYNNIIYNYNNNNLWNNIRINYLIRSIIYRLLYNKIIILNKNNISSKIYLTKLLISNIIIKHTKDKINIIFFIYLPKNLSSPNKSNYKLISRILNNLNNLNNKNILNNINKKLIIQPIYLKYDYFNSDILSQSINKNIIKTKSIRSSYIKNLNLTLPIYKTRNIIMNNIILFNYINSIYSYNTLFNILNINKSLNIKNYNYYNLFINKSITGIQWEFIGKRLIESKRSIKNNFTIGTFKYLTNNKITKFNTLHLNNTKPNLQLSRNNNSYIGPTGKYNINVSISHI
uniref:Small ribosomal subunit protein uS3m n=1 Tax=Groenewaldozyma salmanticensis TaxID=49332 RepID=E5L091_9ASCO|nr:ribosomal protein S3 [Groenewaldozyma salmanticensis]ADO51056.1 ribosomal protein S3 [Groenewaldozyma salmanticensis]